jgi:hypothetical protein
MSNVSPFPAQRQHDAGHAPQPDPVAPIARLVHAIDKAVGKNWSFDLVHHDTAGEETVVFARLIVDGRSRVGRRRRHRGPGHPGRPPECDVTRRSRAGARLVRHKRHTTMPARGQQELFSDPPEISKGPGGE